MMTKVGLQNMKFKELTERKKEFIMKHLSLIGDFWENPSRNALKISLEKLAIEEIGYSNKSSKPLLSIMNIFLRDYGCHWKKKLV